MVSGGTISSASTAEVADKPTSISLTLPSIGPMHSTLSAVLPKMMFAFSYSMRKLTRSSPLAPVTAKAMVGRQASSASFAKPTVARSTLTVLGSDGAPDALVTWGFFNSAFERREYMEAYVAEKVAEQMLAADPELRKAFAQRLATEPEFARDPAARLDFFYRRHLAFDERFNLYPVYRVATPPR